MTDKQAGAASDRGEAHRSLSSQRASEAQDWVERQIHQLTEIIAQHGTTSSVDGQVFIEFGFLFHLYQDISSSLVGILMRAKQRNIISYKGDMLYQSTHSAVTIFLVKKN